MKGAACTARKDVVWPFEWQNIATNTILSVEEIDGNRCRIIFPIKGWVSINRKDGYNLLKRVTKYPTLGKYVWDVLQFVSVNWLQQCMFNFIMFCLFCVVCRCFMF